MKGWETFERKYQIVEGRLVKKSDGAPIPEDEPLFILRAKDKYALAVLLDYRRLCRSFEQKEAVAKSTIDFRDFAAQRPELIGEPDP